MSSSVAATGWMIAYGVEGTHNDVPSSVFDRPYVIARGSLFMETGIDMNYQTLDNLPAPTFTSQAVPKKYVDTQVKAGRTMTGDIDMSANKITNLAYPVLSTDAATKQYVDISGIVFILNSATATYIDGYIKQNAECVYSCERELKTEVSMTPNSRNISTLFYQTLSGLNAVQTVSSRIPKLSTGKNAKRYYFTFDGVDDRMISSIDLNPASGANDIVHVFMLYRLHSHNGSNAHFRNGLFGHDNGGWDKFVVFDPTNSNAMRISGVQGASTVDLTSSDWQTKADASVLNKWICLSVHWDVPAGAAKSSCWVNGKKVKTFRAATSAGATQMTFGDFGTNGIAGLNGDIQMFLLYKRFSLDDLIIKAHHKMICERYGVDHTPISFP